MEENTKKRGLRLQVFCILQRLQRNATYNMENVYVTIIKKG